MSTFWSRAAEPAKPATAAAPAPRASPAAVAPAPAAAASQAPPSGPQTTPVGPFKLKVVQLPNSALAYTNQIYISSRTPWMLQGKGAEPTYYLLEGKGVFLVSAHDAVNPGEVAMSGMQRDSFGLSQGFDVNCAFFNPAREHVHTMVAMTIQIEYLKAQATEVKEEDVANFVKERLAGQIFKVEQMFPVDLGGKIFKCTVREIHAAPEKEDEKSTAHKRQNSEEFLLRTDLGQLQSSAMVYVTAVKNKYLQFVPSAKNVRRNLLRPDWKFSKMGIGGLDDEFATIFRRAFASRLFPQEIIEQLGIKHCKGILLFGPPGTGKTLIARQIGKLLESREPKVVNGPEILNRYVGASEEAIRALFKDAEDDYKANGENSDLHLIIFDEIDAICKSRGSTRDGTGVHDTVVNQLLSKIDGVNALNNILVIGMTNRKDLLDEALLRPGRLEVHVEISLPDKKGRRQILEIHTQKMRDAGRIDPNLDLDELAEVTKNFSGAEIEGLVRDAVSHALYSHVDPNKLGSGAFNMDAVDDLIVTMAEFKLALEEIKPAFGVAQDELKAFARDTLVSYSTDFDDLMRVARSFVTQVRDNKNTQLLSVLLEGPIGCGKTAIAAQLALESEFPLVRLVTPDNYIGYSESSKVNLVNKVFEDAYKSPLSIVILDNIERLIEYSPIGPRFSNSILQSLLVLLKRSPPDDRRHLLIVATTSNIDVLQQLEVRQNFNFSLKVPSVRDPSELKRVFAQRRVHIEPSEVEEIASAVKFPIPIKQLLTLIEMSTEDDEVTSRKFVENLQFMAAYE